MSEKKCLLLSPVYSRYQILSSKIIETYIKKALKNVDPNNHWKIQNIIENTPYGMYKNNVLQPYGSLPFSLFTFYWVDSRWKNYSDKFFAPNIKHIDKNTFLDKVGAF